VNSEQSEVHNLLQTDFVARCITNHLKAAYTLPTYQQTIVYQKCLNVFNTLYDPSAAEPNVSSYLALYRGFDPGSVAYAQRVEQYLASFVQQFETEFNSLIASVAGDSDSSCHLITPQGNLPCDEALFQHAKEGNADYYASFNGVGMAELQGGRPSQEDRMIAMPLSETMQRLAGFSNEEIQHFISKVWFPALHALCDNFLIQQKPYNPGFYNPAHNSGSCFLGFLILPEDSGKKRLVSISLGDSMLFIQRANGQLEWVNQYQHSTKNPREIERIGQANLPHGRVGGALAVTGAFGDEYFRHYGITVEPQIDIITLEPGDKVVASCDGLTEARDFHVDLTGRNPTVPALLQNITLDPRFQRLNYGQQAFVLARLSMFLGSKDNVSVLKSDQPGFYGIFDGHADALTSQNLQQISAMSLEQCILAANKEQSSVPRRT
jgi:serine/threonine protein phosphatase PrpC